MAILVPKLVAMATTLRHSISAISLSDSWRWLSNNQSYSLSKAKKMVAMATPLSCRLSAMSEFGRSTTQTPPQPIAYSLLFTQSHYSKLRPKLVAMATSSTPLDPHLTHDSLGPPESTTQTASRSVQSFLHTTDDRRVYFTTGRPFPLKIAPSHGDLDPI